MPLESEARESFQALLPKLDEVRALARAQGLWLPQIPKEHGGMGMSVLEHGLVSEVHRRTCKRLATERNRAARERIYQFPLEFAGVKRRQELLNSPVALVRELPDSKPTPGRVVPCRGV